MERSSGAIRQALHQRRATANHQRFGKIQLEHAQQNEQKFTDMVPSNPAAEI